MDDMLQELGRVKLVQVQPNGLIIETPAGGFYDASRRLEVDQLRITTLGIEATTPDGEDVLDIHHKSHPDKAYGDDDLVSIGFTAHYEKMREQFGQHMVDGIAGENIIIEYESEIWPEDLGQRMAIENQETGQMALLDLVSYAKPCREFSQFAMNSQHEKPPAKKMKETLQFLNKGRRGFLLLLVEGQENAVVRRGDKVFVVNDD